MDLSLIPLALFCGFWQFISTADFGHTLSDTLGQPVVVGVILGLLMGDLASGLAIGGSLELLYLGIIYPGGTIPVCTSSASLIAIPIALSTGMDAGAATVLAVPFGIFGAMVWNVKYSINSAWSLRADKCLEEKDFKGAILCGTLYPLALAFAVSFFPVFACNLAAPSVVTALIDSIPDWGMHGIEVAGELLPAIGFAIAVSTIGKREIMAFFLIGFFLVQYLDLDAMAIGIFGSCIAVLYLYWGKRPSAAASAGANEGTGQTAGDSTENEITDASFKKILSKKDIAKTYSAWYWFLEVPHSYDRMQGLSLMVSMARPLRKMYPDDGAYQQAMQRTAQFYNTEGTIGSIINGMALSMEEERAAGAGVPAEVMYSIRSGLMGPMSGIGDSLVWGTFKTICLSLATTFALSGNPLAIVVALVFPVSTYFIGRSLFLMGYTAGREAVVSMLKSGLMDRVVMACSILGLMMMGALSASYVSLSVTMEFALENSADPISIQGILDSIAPGILPLAVIVLVHLYLKKHNNKYGLFIVGIITLSILGAFFGIV